MTTPTLTYGHGWLKDFTEATVDPIWVRTAGAPDLDGATFTNLYLDRGVIACVVAEDGDSCYWTWNTDIEKSTTTYTKILIRWGTSVSATGLGFMVKAIFSDASEQWIIGDGATPIYSANGFTTTSATLSPTAPGSDLDHIRLYAVSEKNANSESISIDFILVYKGMFQFPDLKGGFEQQFQNNYGRTKIALRKGNNTSYLGCSDSPFHIYGDISYEDSATYPAGSPSWRDGSMPRSYLIYGQFIRELLDTADTNPWQWMTSNLADCKVTVDGGTLRQIKTDDDILWFEMYLYEFRQSSSSNETYVERWGLKSFI